MSILFENKLKFVVDRLFYLEKSYLILAAWIAVNRKERVTKGEFILSVHESCRYPYAAETAGILSFLVAVDYLLLTHSYPSQSIEIETRLDCMSALRILWKSKIIFSTSQHLHQVAREIYLLKIK